MAEMQTGTGTSQFIGPINNEALTRFVRQIEELQGERAGVNERMGDVYEAAKAAGFVPAILREIIRERKLEDKVRQDRYALLEAYRGALGMLADTPLGEAALRTAENVAAATGAAAKRRGNGQTTMPKPFAQQPVTQAGETQRRSRGRPRKDHSATRLFTKDNPNGDLPPAA
jgi:uncharacterized protein (UPF0335 family)